MYRFSVRAGLVIAGALSASAALAWMAAGVKLYINGKQASSDVIVRDGTAYVPLRDVAAAFDMVVEKRPDGYTMVRAGGANQLGGLTGHVGDDLFNGRYRFKVVKVVRGPKYTKQFAGGHDVVDASAGRELIAVVCRLKNGTKEAQTVDLMPGRNTALTDEDEHSFEPITGLWMDIPERAPKLLPGAATDFVVLFHVPENAVLKDLVYSICDFSGKPGADFRVSLKE